MNKSQSNYLNMAKAVCDVFDNSKTVWKDKPLITAANTRLKTLCNRQGSCQAEGKCP
jgi:hypothetical protein